MIIKIWRYKSQAKSAVGGAAKQARSFDVALGCSCYILDIAAPSNGSEAFITAERVGDYTTADNQDRVDMPQRILDRYSDNLNSDDLREQVSNLAVHAGAAGLERVWHLTWSHRPDESVGPEIMRKERQTIRRILGLQDSPGIGAYHGDEDHEHGHDLSVSTDVRTGKPVVLGERWWKEAAQIACAVCEFEHSLEPEPNRRYVADSTGVYHTFTDIRVAEADGTFVRGSDGKADHHVIKELQKAHAKILANNTTPENEMSGAKWPLDKAVATLAAQRIKEAKTWLQVHEKLARVGLRYVKVGNTAVIEAVQYCASRGDQEIYLDDDDGDPVEEKQDARSKSDYTIGAGKVYSNAALGKLERRFKEKYSPPPPDFEIRKFIMPRYDKIEEDAKAVPKAERKELKRSAQKLDARLKEDNRERQREVKEANPGTLYNDQISRRAAVSEIEQELARDFAISIGARPRRRKPLKRKNAKSGAKALRAEYFSSIIWSAFRSREVQKRDETEAKLKTRYQVIKTLGRVEYWEGQRLAFIETQNFIAIQSTARKAKIDALRLARAKLSSVRVFGKPDTIADTVFLAAELGLRMEDDQEKTDKKHLKQAGEDPGSGALRRHRAWMRVKPKLRSLLSKKIIDRGKRRHQASQFGSDRIARYENANAIAVETEKQKYGGTTALGNARKNLKTIDRNELTLASSRLSRGSYRYLDDPVLLQKFAATPNHLLIPGMQRRLEAIERVQQEQRNWVCAAILSGRITIKNDAVEAPKGLDKWAVEFYSKQKSDPTFRRLMLVSQLRPDRFQIDLDVPPELNVWREARSAGDTNMASFAADELHLRTRTNKQVSSSGNEERELIFAVLPKEAQALRDTPGSFLSEYGSRTFRRHDESKAQWNKRRSLIKKNNQRRR